jgi:hypothetical protein
MTEHTKEIYRTDNSNLDFILQRISDRLDQLEGRRGIPEYWKSEAKYKGESSLSTNQVPQAKDTESTEFSTLSVDHISGLGTMAIQDADDVAITGGSIEDITYDHEHELADITDAGTMAAQNATHITVTEAEIDGDLNHDGSKAGFFGTDPITQRAKADYNNWANFSDIVDALVALGLFDAP